MNDPDFSLDLKEIQSGIRNTFSKATKWIESLSEYRGIYFQPSPQKQSYEMTTPEQFEQLLERFGEQITFFSTMPIAHDITIIRIDCNNLKQQFAPVPKERLKFIQLELPRMAHVKCQTLAKEITQMNENIMRSPATVADFVVFKDHLRAIHNREEEIERRFTEIQQMFELVTTHKIRISKEASQENGKLQQIKSTLATNLNISDSGMDASVEKFTAFMNDAVPDLVKNIETVRTHMDDQKLEQGENASDEQKLQEMLEYINENDEKLQHYEETAVKYARYQQCLEMDITEYEELTDTRNDLNLKKELWFGLDDWNKKLKAWQQCRLGELRDNLEIMTTEIKNYMKLVSKVGRYLHGDHDVVEILKQKVVDLKTAMPIVEHLGSPALETRHWESLTEIMGHDIQNDQSFTLGTMFEKNILQFEKQIGEIAVQAAQEQSLAELLTKVIDMWNECDLPLQNYKDIKDVYILGNLDEIVGNLDESLVTINTINSSRYVDPIREEVAEWSKKLVLFQETLDEWIAMQKKWMYLEIIFSGGDIAKQLPSETTLFNKIDKYWKSTMSMSWDNPDAMLCGTYAGRKETMASHNNSLERIEKSLEEYLETKRQIFPRFYFLSNDELLEILADSKNPTKVQPHLRKCFDNIYSLDLQNDKSHTIKAMVSGEGERVPSGKNLKCGRKPVEEWLGLLEVDMKKQVRKLIKAGITDYLEQTRTEWIVNHFAQVVMCASQIMWCQKTEEVLLNGSENAVKALQEWYNVNLQQIDDIMVLIRGDLKKIDRSKIVALVTTDVHSRDVIRRLIDNQCESVYDFEWQKQLRFYWDFENDDCVVRQISAELLYGYEYMGVASRLVITPLTDRCWITVTGALHIKLGASPAGPAGTGKTESVKDLAKGLGVQCVVFNCSDQIDYKMMGKFFSGLAQTGSWTCLDEFNRIQIEVLSVVAQQLLSIRQALLQSLTKFNFEGIVIPLKPTFGVNITMNPGYAGRTELPDNLKVLFRPVAMMIPDYGLIAEIMLFAAGFGEATSLSKKMVKLYKLSSEQMSQADHYDFGMRALKSVLVMAGTLKRSEPDVSENVVLIRAMRDSNVPKFLSDDLPLFNAIVQDLFPNVVIPEHDYGNLEKTINNMITNRKLQKKPCFVTKVIQLFDTFDVRFGVMLVGPTGGGKTEIYRVLSDAMTNLRVNQKAADQRFQKVHLHVLNPKSISMGELYGEMNLLTQEWVDGLASSIMRESIKDTTDDRHWVVFDGPVDTLWIESMNTVLDDNMTLCLANGERIKLKSELRMLFEVRDLAVASPATVSRCGMVYVPPAELGILPYIKSFFEKQKEYGEKQKLTTRDHLHADDKSGIVGAEYDKERLYIPEACAISKVSPAMQQHIQTLFEENLPKIIEFQRKHTKSPIYTHDAAIVESACNLFASLFSTKHGIDPVDTSDNVLQLIIDKLFIFTLTWTVAGGASVGLNEFDECIREMFSNVTIPKAGTVFDYCVNCKTNSWILWKDYVAEFTFDPNVPYTKILVPTMDIFRFSFLTEKMLDVRRSVFLTGDSGVGKTSIINDMLDRIREPSQIHSITLNFSAQTGAKSTQLSIEKKLQKKTKTMYGGPGNKHVVIFVDDINMPTKEEFGAQPPIEVLRQFQDYYGFYDREKWFWKQIVDTTILCSAAPPGGGRSELTERFTRHFLVLNVPKPSDEVLTKIFQSIIDGFLETGGFKEDLKTKSNAIVQSTIDLYSDISKSLLPIPAKSHYTFNLRDISKVFQGVLMVKPSTVNTTDKITKLWVHEASRCFHDRLINEDDRVWFQNKIVDCLMRHFHVSWNTNDIFAIDKLSVWGDFFKPGAGDNVYEEFEGTVKDLSKVLTGYLDDFNMETSTPMNLVFFNDAILHLLRIVRILRQPRGNAMLVGVGGSGRQSLTKLSCFISDFECFQIELKRGYDYTLFRDDLRELMMKAGAQGKQTVFLFNDTQIIDERFLEDINNILNSGEVPNLFSAPDEFSAIDDALHPYMKEREIPITPDNTWNTFVSRVRDNLHLVLCFSPVGDAFRSRCRMFPSLINCCTIDWFSKWPRNALLSVSNRFLNDLEFFQNNEELKDALADMCVEIHESVQDMCEKFYNELRRKVYTTPKSYLDMIKLYLRMLEQKREQFLQRRKILTNGLKKLNEANSVVATLQKEIEELQPLLVVKSKDANELLAKIAVDQKEADQVKETVEKEAKIVGKQADETKAIQADAQADLDKALPALQAANNALKTLNKGDVTEVKNMAKPPPGVVMVMEAVLILLKEKTTWDNAKKVMSNTNFLKMLQDFDKDNIPENIVKKLKTKYTSNADFTVERMQKVSVAATTLCKWVHAMVVYSEVVKTVEPKKKRLAEMNAKLEAANAALKKQKDALQAIEDKVNKLKQQCDTTLKQKQDLEFQSDQCKGRLERANKLTVGLADEQIRWAQQEKQLKIEIEKLVGDVFICAAFVSYASPFTGVYRSNLTKLWLNKLHESHENDDNDKNQQTPIPCSEKEHFGLIKVLGDPLEIRKWNAAGLPTDDVSIESGIVATQGERWPLMIDPQNQAKTWIRNLEKQNNLKLVKLDDPNLLRVLETGIRNGNPVLIQDIEEQLDPSIDPILNKATFSQGGRLLIHLGDSDIDYDPSFRFYISTKLSNPHYLPEISIKVTLINFTVTKNGLTDQLLGNVVKKERPEIEQKRQELIQQMAKDKQELKDIEKKILKLLSESQGNILDDHVLIETLESSKFTSNIINERVSEAEKTEIVINDTRNQYYSVAKRGSIIFFVIADMSAIDPMYQYSLSYFQRLFNSCIDKSEKADTLEERLTVLKNNITLWIYMNICRGLFERHKLNFSFLICASIMLDNGDISQTEWMYLLRGVITGMITEAQYETKPENPDPDGASSGLQNKTWNQIFEMETLFPDHFQGLMKEVTVNLNSSFWINFLNKKEPHGMLFSAGAESDDTAKSRYVSKLTSFQKLMLLKTVRYEKIVFGIASFVRENLGEQFVSLPPTRLSDVYEDTDKTTPIIFVLSTGADPQSVLLRFASDMGFDKRLNILSLGQGQGVKAEKLINQAIHTGDWVCLQNCHLAKSWMPSLEKIVLNIAENPHQASDEFRLWLTSMPCNYFPIPVLQNGVKITNEPPRGIRANLMRSYTSIDDEFFSESVNTAVSKKAKKEEPNASGQPQNDDEEPQETESEIAFNNQIIDKKRYIWRRLLFGLSFFHAVIQERRKFGALGFNKAYEFNDSDLETSMTVLQMFLNDANVENDDSESNGQQQHDISLQLSSINVPWDALRYVIGEINYGGRVTDDWDRRCLMTILQKYYTTEILDKNTYELAADANATYHFDDGDIQYYKKYVTSLPSSDDPVVFGMHENANITHQTHESHTVLETILSIQPKNAGPTEESQDDETSENSGTKDSNTKQTDKKKTDENKDASNNDTQNKSPDQMVSEIAADILEKLPQLLGLEDEGKQTLQECKYIDFSSDPSRADEQMMDSLIIFLGQEIERFNKLITTVSISLRDLQKAIVGEVVMSSELDAIFNDLLTNKVPQAWKAVAYPSLKPLGSWIDDLNKRIAFMRTWLTEGSGKPNKHNAYWMSAFFFTQGFITGTLQNYARKYTVAIDTLSFKFQVLNDKYVPDDLNDAGNDEGEADGVLVYGLYLDGCQWNNVMSSLEEANLGELYCKMPLIRFEPCSMYKPQESNYLCPVYKTSVRAGTLSTTGQSTNYILPVELPTANHPPNHWIMQGVALLTQLDD